MIKDLSGLQNLTGLRKTTDMNLSHVITSQFQHPRGFLGNLAGIIMAWENRERKVSGIGVK
ncbi:MAG: hypothetical protein A2W37_09670 [Chloroflexi bacterium RBG_16_63_12]|nr:MAG: hypothetical protein A2W37_09670 [Chloroflexi bacterium RBG_16_63_12]